MIRSPFPMLLAVLAIVPVVAASSQEKSGKAITGWGEFIDPDGDSQAKTDGPKLVITVPGTVHDLSAELSKVNAPRVLRHIEGDFIAQVLVSGTVRPGAVATVRTRLPFNGAGILLWHDDKNYVRVERAAIIQGDKLVSYGLFEIRKNGRLTPAPSFQIQDHDTYVRLERHGRKLHASLSDDGVRWVAFQTLDVDLPNKLKIGVAAVNSSTTPFMAQLEQLEVFVKEKNEIGK